MIPYSCQSINEDDRNEVLRVLQSSHLTQGKEVPLFEKALCEYIGCKYAVTFNSATSALLASYSVAEITKGDEVITSPISFVATSNMLVSLDAKPIWCDIKLDGNIDERFIERLITDKTKAIVPIDFAGKPLAIKKIQEIADRHKLLIIEDASHALGSVVDGEKVGLQSDMTIFSFHAIKPITTGEGGCVVTNDKQFAEKLRLFRSHGIQKKRFWDSDMLSLGYNLRMSDFAAALGRSQLKRLDTFISQREEIAQYYDARFKQHKLFTSIKIENKQRSSRHLYPILLNPELQCQKEDIFSELQALGIGVQVHYKPIYQNSFYTKKFGKKSLLVANDFYRSELSLPCHQEMHLKDAKIVADIFLKVLDKYNLCGCSF